MLASRVDDQGDLARARCSAEGNVADADLDEKTVGRDLENDRKIDPADRSPPARRAC